jgi:hypothetical protein
LSNHIVIGEAGEDRHTLAHELAHELAHVIQQRSGPPVAGAVTAECLGVSHPTDRLEREAEATASRVLRDPSGERLRPFATNPASRGPAHLPPEKLVQRHLKHFKEPGTPTPDESLVMQDAVMIDQLTTAAYTNTWNHLAASTRPANPTPLAIGLFPGLTPGYFSNMYNKLDPRRSYADSVKSMAVGYVIEDQVTHSQQLPNSVCSQVTQAGGAILDFVVTRGSSEGVVDVTSAGQAGHVLLKAFNKSRYSYIGEAIYPSIDFSALGGAAPALTAAAVQLVEQSYRRRANEYISAELKKLVELLELYSGGIMHNDHLFGNAVKGLKASKNQLLRAPSPWSNQEIAHIDQQIASVNEQVAKKDPGFASQQTLSEMIAYVQGNYVVAGNPMWPVT